MRRALGPGESTRVAVEVEAPSRPGSYVLEMDLVQEGVGWFGEHGSPVAQAAVRVEGHARHSLTKPIRKTSTESSRSSREPGRTAAGFQVALDVRTTRTRVSCHLFQASSGTARSYARHAEPTGRIVPRRTLSSPAVALEGHVDLRRRHGGRAAASASRGQANSTRSFGAARTARGRRGGPSSASAASTRGSRRRRPDSCAEITKSTTPGRWRSRISPFSTANQGFSPIARAQESKTPFRSAASRGPTPRARGRGGAWAAGSRS